MPFDEPDATQLVDTRRHPDVLRDTAPTGDRPQPVSSTEETMIAPADRLAPPVIAPSEDRSDRIATISERFAAGLLDAVILWGTYWGGNNLYHLFSHGYWYGPAPTNLHASGTVFHALFLLVAALYFFVAEGLIGASIGKWCCALIVRRPDGGLPSLGAIVLRTIFRALDVLPLVPPGLLGLIVMESTTRHQRIGDLIANTVVIKRMRATVATPVTWDRLAGTGSRLLAGLCDGVLWVALIVASVLLLNDDHPFASFWMVLLLPSAWLIVIAALTRWTHTTPGLWLTGHRLVQENGLPLQFSHAIVRTVLLLVDATGLGLLAVLLSPRKQRVGDLVAGTLAIREPRTMAGAAHWLALLALITTSGYGAWHNPHRLVTDSGDYRRAFNWGFLPVAENFSFLPALSTPVEPFLLHNFRFAEGRPDNTRQPPSYVAGETAWFLFDIHGYQLDGDMVWLQEDLAIRYPDNSFGLRQENIIDYHQVLRTKGPVELKNNVRLPEGFPVGQYTVYLTIRDKNTPESKPIVHTETFFVK